ncbi:MAG TPA: hypothetical protein VF860_15780, partial [Candidatus Acidoferrales bacterium]
MCGFSKGGGAAHSAYSQTPHTICAHLNPSQSHNAQEFETVTVYYQWHPLAGQKLIVHGRLNRNGERVLCRLPDGTVGSLPAWMLR